MEMSLVAPLLNVGSRVVYMDFLLLGTFFAGSLFLIVTQLCLGLPCNFTIMQCLINHALH